MADAQKRAIALVLLAAISAQIDTERESARGVANPLRAQPAKTPHNRVDQQKSEYQLTYWPRYRSAILPRAIARPPHAARVRDP